jgi:alkyl sulfatase BDS1-like metallo-beta-lactamase superfamily hydrolase
MAPRQISTLPDGNPYMGAPVALTTLANGAITHADSQHRLAQSTYGTPTVDRVAPGVTVFGGDGFLNLTLIEGDDGLIVYDTGEVLEDGERFLAQIRTVSDKPIVAVLYSHSHYVHGTTALVGDGRGVQIVGHPNVNANLAGNAAGTTFPETAPLQTSRVLQQFNHFVPEHGPDAPAGAAIRFGRSGMLPVNRPVDDGECLTIAGVRMQCFTRHGSDTDDCLTVHLPDRGVVLNNILWPFVPNVYTLRGARFRDPREWRDALRTIADLDPEVLVSTHARAVRGREAARAALEHVIDALDLLLDQTLRGILLGLGPDELRGFVRLPDALASHPNLAQIYGEVSHFGPYLYHHALGWFDGDAASINPLPPAEQAARLVDAMGGREDVVRRARDALALHEYAWAAQLLQYLYRLDPLDKEVRALKADALQAMGRVTPAHTVRSWYVTHARALRGEVDVPRLQFASPRVLALSPPAETMMQYRVRIDPERAGTRTDALVLRFRDRDARHGWRLRRGVARFEPTPAADAGVELEASVEAWLRFFTCRDTLDRFLDAALVVHGTRQQAADFFDLFDFHAPGDNHLVPPA